MLEFALQFCGMAMCVTVYKVYTNPCLKSIISFPSLSLYLTLLQLIQAIGSIEAIAKASKNSILQTTDLSTEKAETITRFFRDPRYYLGPKIK